MASFEVSKNFAKGMATVGIVLGSVSVAIPDPVYSKVCMALATGLNSASLYLLTGKMPTPSKQ